MTNSTKKIIAIITSVTALLLTSCTATDSSSTSVINSGNDSYISDSSNPDSDSSANDSSESDSNTTSDNSETSGNGSETDDTGSSSVEGTETTPAVTTPVQTSIEVVTLENGETETHVVTVTAPEQVITFTPRPGESSTPTTSGSESDTETESGSSSKTTTTVTTKTPTTTTTKKVTTTSIKVTAYDAIMYANCVANVRSGNSTSYDILTTVQKNTQIRVTGKCDNGWYKVTVNNTVGYMSSTVLSSEKVATTTTTTTKKPATTTTTTTKKQELTGQVDAQLDREESYKMIELINELRVENGLPELTIDERIMEAAAVRAEELSVLFSHTRPNGEGGTTAIWDAYGDEWYDIWYRGENIAMNNGGRAEYTFRKFCESEGHKNTMLQEEFTLVGVGFYSVHDSAYGTIYYCCQLFGGYNE